MEDFEKDTEIKRMTRRANKIVPDKQRHRIVRLFKRGLRPKEIAVREKLLKGSIYNILNKHCSEWRERKNPIQNNPLNYEPDRKACVRLVGRLLKTAVEDFWEGKVSYKNLNKIGMYFQLTDLAYAAAIHKTLYRKNLPNNYDLCIL